MISKNTLTVFLLIEVPFYMSLWAIGRDWSMHYDNGGLFVLTGHFFVVFATLVLTISTIIATALAILAVLLFFVARMNNMWAKALIVWIERKFPPQFDGSRYDRPT